MCAVSFTFIRSSVRSVRAVCTQCVRSVRSVCAGVSSVPNFVRSVRSVHSFFYSLRNTTHTFTRVSPLLFLSAQLPQAAEDFSYIRGWPGNVYLLT